MKTKIFFALAGYLIHIESFFKRMAIHSDSYRKQLVIKAIGASKTSPEDKLAMFKNLKLIV